MRFVRAMVCPHLNDINVGIFSPVSHAQVLCGTKEGNVIVLERRRGLCAESETVVPSEDDVRV